MTRPVIAIVPTFLRTPQELDVLLKCLVSLRATAPAAQVLAIDDGSPGRDLVTHLAHACVELDCALVAKDENEGFSRTVNVGLQHALETGADTVLVNADVEFHEPRWLEAMLARADSRGRPAAVVGARLLYPNGLLQHAGVYFSLLHRAFFHRFQYGPADLPEALAPALCPVTAALQLIRWETLQAVGVYDPEFNLAFEDVDYCLRVFAAGLECVYEPTASAIHHESLFRGQANERIREWTERSRERLITKWAGADFTPFIPEAI